MIADEASQPAGVASFLTPQKPRLSKIVPGMIVILTIRAIEISSHKKTAEFQASCAFK